MDELADVLRHHDLLAVASVETLPALERFRLVQGFVRSVWASWALLPRVTFEVEDGFLEMVWRVIAFVGGAQVLAFLEGDEEREARLFAGEFEPDVFLLM